MSINLPEIDLNADTFGDWLDRTNEISRIISENVVTANSEPTEGFVEIEGELRANTAYFDEVYGGTANNESAINVYSNVYFNEPIETVFLKTENIIITYGYEVSCYIDENGDISNVNNCYGGSSDETIKWDIRKAKSQWDDIKNIEVKKYKLIKDGRNGTDKLGVIAQDLEKSGMEGLVFEKDGIKNVKYSVLYMKALKALQEAMKRIEDLEKQYKILKATIEKE